MTPIFAPACAHNVQLVRYHTGHEPVDCRPARVLKPNPFDDDSLEMLSPNGRECDSFKRLVCRRCRAWLAHGKPRRKPSAETPDQEVVEFSDKHPEAVPA